MARIGNEAKLILKLAAERANQKKPNSATLDGRSMNDMQRGFIRGIEAYEAILKDITIEMEK